MREKTVTGMERVVVTIAGMFKLGPNQRCGRVDEINISSSHGAI